MGQLYKKSPDDVRAFTRAEKDDTLQAEIGLWHISLRFLLMYSYRTMDFQIGACRDEGGKRRLRLPRVLTRLALTYSVSPHYEPSLEFFQQDLRKTAIPSRRGSQSGTAAPLTTPHILLNHFWCFDKGTFTDDAADNLKNDKLHWKVGLWRRSSIRNLP